MTTYQKIYIHQKSSCFYCNEKTPLSLMEREHVFPRSKGGRGIKNKVLSCHFCNTLKSNLIISDFKIKISELLKTNTYPHKRLSAILITLNKLECNQNIRDGWHQKALYKTNNINIKPVNKLCII